MMTNSTQLEKHMEKTDPEKLKRLKENKDLEKKYVKFYFDLLYYYGTGECWYEDRPPRSTTFDILYKMWSFASFAYIYGGFFNEYAAYFTKLNEDEWSALIHHSLGHSVIFSKSIVLFIQRNSIKEFFKRYFETNREFFDEKLAQKSVRDARISCFVLNFSVYLCLSMSFVSSLVDYIRNGKLIRTIITVYPYKDSPSLPYNIFRILIEIHWYYSCTVMNIIDCLSLCALVYLSYKFKYLQLYFESLREKYSQLVDKKSRDDLEIEYEKDFIVGIRLHQDALWCARNVQSALGPLYSIQIVEGIVLICVCLLEIVNAGGDLASVWASFTYMICIIVLTASYLIPGGNVTNEAARLPLSILYGGWDILRPRRRLRTIIVTTIINCQVPVIMTAFGIVQLSYSNLIMVFRHSYSFYAVMR